MSQEEGQDTEPFVACYPGPIYRSTSDLPPASPAEPSTSDTIPTVGKTITLTQNTGPIYICDNVRIVGESIDIPHTNENVPDMTTPEPVRANKKRASTENFFGIPVTKEDIIKGEGTPTPKKLKIKRDIIQQHILSYKLMRNPDGSKYLPKHLTQDAMYKDYISKNPHNKCGMPVYVEQLKEMGISRQRSKNCNCCVLLDEVQKQLEELKSKRKEHDIIANEALPQYTEDRREADSKSLPETKKYYSMTLEDEILLPEIPSSEEICHVSRLVGFNLTLAPINVSKSKAPWSYCMMWHEALAAADESTIVDALVNFFGNNIKITDFVIWADDNNIFKNWTLFTALTTLINCKHWNAKSIHIKYLSKWHVNDSQMSADSVIKSIENNMKRKEIFDFNALTNIVKSSRRNVAVSEVTQFRDWPKDKLKDSKLNDLLPSMVEVKFDRFSRKLLFKNTYKGDFEELDFLDDKFNVTSFSPLEHSERRGISKEKKENIILKFDQSISEETKSFWMNLPENDNSEDLMT